MHLNGSISVSKTTILSLKDEHENDCQRRAQAVLPASEDEDPAKLAPPPVGQRDVDGYQFQCETVILESETAVSEPKQPFRIHFGI